MAFCIAIMGESGSGKTTSLRNLPPKETMYIDCDQKGLSWKGWRKDFCTENKNYFRTASKEMVASIIDKVGKSDAYKHIHYIVVDTLNGIMVNDEMERMTEKGYDKWQDLAQSVYLIIVGALKLRDDLTVIFTCHSETETDENGGAAWTRIKTSGRKLNKIVLESLFPVVLHAKVVDGKHVFEVHANKSTAKTPLNCFEEDTVSNDIMPILEKLEDYK